MSDSVQSRSEGILRDIIDGTSEYPHKKGKSRIEDLLIELLEEGGGGGGGDSTIYATSLSLTINPSTFVMTAQLLNKDGDPLGTAQTVDLPLESVVVNGTYDSQTKKVILTLQNGNTIEFSVADLVDGLQTEITSTNKLSADLVDDTSATNKFVTAADITNWNAKQNAITSTNMLSSDLVDDTNSTNKFVTASDKTTWNAKQEAIDSSHKLSADLVDDGNATNKFVTTAEKTAWNNKQNALMFDNVPTSGSSNPVKSGGVYSDLAGKVDKETGKGLSTNDYTTAEKTKLGKAVTTDDIGIETDYFVYNGIRVYVSSTEPTGNIPDGSIWIGG